MKRHRVYFTISGYKDVDAKNESQAQSIIEDQSLNEIIIESDELEFEEVSNIEVLWEVQ